MKASRYESACPKLAESYHLDERPGVLFTLAECEAKAGKFASACAHYDDYLRLYTAMPPGMQKGQRERADIAKRQRASLTGRVPMLLLTLPAGAPAGLLVRRDDVLLGAPSFGKALPVDPGPHTIVVVMPDGGSRSRVVTLSPGDHVHLDVSTFFEEPFTEATAPGAAAPGARRAPAAAFVMLGVGGVGLVIGGVTGGLALASKGTVAAHCVDTVCDPEGKQAADRARTLGWASTVGFGVGLAAAATGAALWIFAPRRAAQLAQGPIAPSAWVVDHTTVTGVTGRF